MVNTILIVLIIKPEIGVPLSKQQVETPCGACGEHTVTRERFAFAGWRAHTEFVVETVQRMGRPVGERSSSSKYCRGFTNHMTALRSGRPIDGDSWQEFGGQRFRRWKRPRTKVKTDSK